MKLSETIIFEEIQKFLNESYIMNDDRFHFKERLTNSSFYNYSAFTNEFDSEVTESDIVVNWGISFWLNDMGVENFIVDVESVEGTFLLKLFDKQNDEQKQETPKNINDFEWKFIIDNDANLQKGSSLYINGLSFDFKNKNCIVKF